MSGVRASAVGPKEVVGGQGRSLTVPVGGEPALDGVGPVVLWDAGLAAELFDALRADTAIPGSGTDWRILEDGNGRSVSG